MAKITFGKIKTMPVGTQIVVYLTVTIAVASFISGFIWLFYEFTPIDVGGQWIFTGTLNTNVPDEDEKYKYNGWSIRVESNGNMFEGFDGSTRVLYGLIGGKDINFIIEMNDTPDGCGDFSNFTGIIEKSWALSPYNKITGTISGNDCENFIQWSGTFLISIFKFVND